MTVSRLRRLMNKYPQSRWAPVWAIRLDVARQHREARANRTLSPEFAPPKVNDPQDRSLFQMAKNHPCPVHLRRYQFPWSHIVDHVEYRRRIPPCRSMLSLPLP